MRRKTASVMYGFAVAMVIMIASSTAITASPTGKILLDNNLSMILGSDNVETISTNAAIKAIQIDRIDEIINDAIETNAIAGGIRYIANAGIYDGVVEYERISAIATGIEIVDIDGAYIRRSIIAADGIAV